MPWMERVQNNLVSGWNLIKTSATQVAAAATLAFKSAAVRQSIYENVSYAWDGFKQKFRLTKISSAIISSNTIRKIYRQALIENIIYYAGSVLLFENVVKPVIFYVPYSEIPQVEESLDMLAKIFFMRIAIKMFAYNTVYNICLNNAVVGSLDTNQKLKGCDCQTIEKIKANLASPFYFTGNLVTAGLIGLIPGVGKYPASFLKTLAYGQCLVEYRYSELGMCTSHRDEVIQANNAYCFGLGLSLFGVTQFFYCVTSNMTGTESDFIYDAIFSYIFQYYILIALLQTEPLPGKKEGIHFFKYSRVVVDTALTDSLSWIIPRLSNENKRGYYREKFELITEFVLVKGVTQVLIDNNLKSFEKFVQTPAMNLFIDLHQDGIIHGLDTIMKARGYPLWLADYAPKFIASENIFILLKILNDRGWVTTNHFIKNLIRLSVRSREISQELFVKCEDGAEIKEEHIFAVPEVTTVIHPKPEVETNVEPKVEVDSKPQVILKKEIQEPIQDDHFKMVDLGSSSSSSHAMIFVPRKEASKPLISKLHLNRFFRPLTTTTKSLKRTLDPLLGWDGTLKR